VAAGAYDEAVTLPEGVALMGACVEGTVIATDVAAPGQPVISAAGPGVQIRNLTVGPSARIGIKASGARRSVTIADVVLLLEPAGTPQSALLEARATGPRVLRLASRVDAVSPGARPATGISALHEPADARSQVERLYREAFELPAEAWKPGRGVVLERAARARLERLCSVSAASLRDELRSIRREAPAAVDGFAARS